MSLLPPLLHRTRLRPRPAASLLVFLICVAVMGWLLLYVSSDRIVSISYGLPLLICVWYPDRRLLWAMTGAFVAMAAWKTFMLLPEEGVEAEATTWPVQVLNIVVVAVGIHLVIDLVDALSAQKAELEKANRELTAREEEIGRQNEELQAQTEELAQQNEEIQHQAEEMRRQAGELQVQTEELQALNAELGRRHALLETLLGTLEAGDGDSELPARICRLLRTLFGEPVAAAAILERSGDELLVLAQAGLDEPGLDGGEFSRSFSAVIVGQDRTAFVADLGVRPDLLVPRAAGAALRSILATPLRLDGMPIGTVEVYSAEPRQWTSQHFRIIEWVAAHCSLIVEVRRLHSQLLRANADLDRLVKERTAELQEMVNELEHFSYTITHDLRAPLRAMHGFSELLTEECAPMLNEAGRDYLRRIVTSATRMDRLITDALSFSKVMRHEMPVTPQDPAALLAGMIDSYPGFQMPKACIRIAGSLPRVLANEAGLTQCFSNLLGNAVKFVEKGRTPQVTIRAEQRDSLVRLWFEDNGIGIAPEMQARVFGMFQRLCKDYEGTGIGLALVRKVVERMGGGVGVESEPGVGSRFWIELKKA